jgi:hypothetical protein
MRKNPLLLFPVKAAFTIDVQGPLQIRITPTKRVLNPITKKIQIRTKVTPL